MRQKDFQFLTINTRSLWEGFSKDSENIDVTAKGISLHAEPSYIFRDKLDAPKLGGAVDFAIDECGVLYILDAEKCNILIYDPNTKCSEWLECFGGCGDAPGKFRDPKAIALSASDVYVTEPRSHRVQVFARINFQLRRVYSFAPEMEPRDLALDAQENLYILFLKTSSELATESESQTDFIIQQFDKSGQLLDSFSEGLRNPSYLTVRDGFIYVLEADYAKVLRFNTETHEHKEFTLWESEEGKEVEFSGLAVDKARNVYYILLEKSEQEEHRFLYRLDTSKEEEETQKLIQLPQMYDELHMDRAGNLYALDGKAGEVIFLESTQLFSQNGFYISRALDSGMSGLQWHKIVVEAEIPEKTQITVSYYISDDYVKDEDQIPSDVWSQLSPANPEDALILSSDGRYLWLKFELFGDERRTPKIKSVSAYFPRLSYLRYLPAIYQEDAASRDFLERFLSLFETFFFNLEEEIFSVTKYLDVIAIPSDEDSPENDFLSWLGSWLAVAFDENWDTAKKREFLKAVPGLYKKRGTRMGLQEFIKIYTEKEPVIIESFQIQPIEDEKIKETWEALFAGDLYSFCVLLKPQQVKTASQLNTVRRIVQSEKPAHTSGGVVELQPWIYLDMHTYLGVNSTLSEPVFRLGKTSVISRDTVLSDPESGGQFERHARLGMDTVLT